MSDLDYLNFSTDLKRIALWLADGNEPLADKFIEINKRKFENDNRVVGKKKVGEWLRRVSEYKARGWKSAEDALTLSVLLKNRFTL
ncbi:hypothetical protein A3A84_03735 [Candidatus Collierbacteria bacterium RIFCSPLOWO2_01_FULL_50_23]|uniref:Uncharacterized protein n=2 Tax=Candidatus Collieribacteriota TaxID=1752725 RepID=A0A1F5ESR9_9BACT|nr:MAG: hypothetical protein A3D09_01495 [Candidatus Collierbacteria bacterium RIFCSPHIGHO2_02_FULL_49_10]OGD71300.1 MAG: hypothetical protein A2703_03315 [Candidatus Collierbacteria bacterium RIFCSPHIGHO2_01_FULL_50_25]OGD75281.1 MAG: hypothetical protein A3A84_03735 [Candidatus Collierbacteria bacterium RIFCSPLOWO2_01_FULL_50_23]